MGSYSQIIWFMTADKVPDFIERRHIFDCIDVEDELNDNRIHRRYKKLRFRYRTATRGQNIPKDREYFAAAHFLAHGSMEGFCSGHEQELF